MMNAQKVLFADTFRLLNSVKDEVKTAAKEVNGLMYNDEDWEHLSITVNSIVSQAELIKALCQAIVTNCDEFLKNGPYENESAHVTPLEGLAVLKTANVDEDGVIVDEDGGVEDEV